MNDANNINDTIRVVQLLAYVNDVYKYLSPNHLRYVTECQRLLGNNNKLTEKQVYKLWDVYTMTHYKRYATKRV